MKRLGYATYVSRVETTAPIFRRASAPESERGPRHLLNMPATVPGELMKGINAGDPAPSSLSRTRRTRTNRFRRSSAETRPMVR